MAKKSLPIIMSGHRTFAGGMLWDVSDTAAPPDSVRFADNVLPVPLGALTVRNGRQRLFNIDEGEDDQDDAYDYMLGLFRYRLSTGSRFYIFAGQGTFGGSNDVEIGHVASGGWTDITGGFTKDAYWIDMPLRDRLYLFNGQDTPQRYAYVGTTHYCVEFCLGTVTIDSPLVQGTGGALTLNNTYSYKITADHGDDGESNGSAAEEFALTGANNKITMTWTDLAEADCPGHTIVAYNIYRKNVTDGWATWFYVDTVAPGAETYVDIIADASVGHVAGTDAGVPTNHNGPPDGTEGGVWWTYQARALYWGDPNFPNRIWRSDINKPELVRTEHDLINTQYDQKQFIDIPAADPTNPVIGVLISDSYAYVFNRYGARILTIDDNGDMQVIDVVNSLDHGLVSKRAVAADDRGIIFYLSTTGLRKIQGRLDIDALAGDLNDAAELVSRPGPKQLTESISSMFQDISQSNLPKVAIAIYNNLVHVSIARSRTGDLAPTQNNDVLILSLQGGGHTYRTAAHIADWCVVNDPGADYILATASGEGGMVFQEYVVGAVQDHPATGDYSAMKPVDVAFEIEDYERTLAEYEKVWLDSYTVDATVLSASASSSQIVIDHRADGGRQVHSKTLTYTTIGNRYWSGSAKLVTSGAEDDETVWDNLDDGEFRITVNGSGYDVGPIDFAAFKVSWESAPALPGYPELNTWNMHGVAKAIETYLAASTGLVTAVLVAWHNESGGFFQFISRRAGASSEVSDITTHSGPSGTDISGASWLNGSAAIETGANDITGGRTALKWASSSSDGDEYQWSDRSQASGHTEPRRFYFHGMTARTLTRRILGTGLQATFFGDRLVAHVPK